MKSEKQFGIFRAQFFIRLTEIALFISKFAQKGKICSTVRIFLPFLREKSCPNGSRTEQDVGGQCKMYKVRGSVQGQSWRLEVGGLRQRH